MIRPMNKSALICGGNQGIGFGLVKSIVMNADYLKVYATYRDEAKSKDLFDLKSRYSEKLHLIRFEAKNDLDYQALVSAIKRESSVLDLCINSIGVLEDVLTSPERKIEEVSREALVQSFEVNAVTHVLLAQCLKPLFLNCEAPIFAAVSAKVGSLTDNRMGGWYSYRISKAALNMAVKNISIEFKRMHKKSTVIAIHPGTTDTQLSAPFIKNAAKKYTIHQTEETGENILNVIHSLSLPADTGKFFSWDGSLISW